MHKATTGNSRHGILIFADELQTTGPAANGRVPITFRTRPGFIKASEVGTEPALSGLSSTGAPATGSSGPNRASPDARQGSNLDVTPVASLTAFDSGQSYSPRDQVFAALPPEHDLEDFWTDILGD
jgi:hypothetical protein